MSVERRLITTLWSAGLAAFAAMYAPQGLLPQIARDVGAAPSSVTLLISATTLGLAVSVLAWAWVADRVGLRPAMRIAAGAAAVCAVAVPLMPTFEWLLAGRLLHGVALGGIPALAMTLSHEVFSPARAAAAAGSYVAATSVGGLSGRLLAVPAADQWGWRIALFVLGAAVAILMLAMIGLIPPTPGGQRPESTVRVLAAHLRNPRLWPIVLVGMVLSGAVMIVFNCLPFRLIADPYDLAPTMVSLIFLTYLGGTAGSRGTGWLSERFGAPAVLGGASAMVAVGAAVTVAHPLLAIVAGVAVLTAGFFIGHAVASSMVAARAPSGRAQATSLYTIGYYLGSSLFGWLGGVVWSHGRWFAVAALVVALGVIALALTVMGQAPSSRGSREPVPAR
ncbi:MFS transporter [Mycobacterium sp. 236(2023)]|uniref:MFS transporter n=1 Tax=Mycobacterium sp. 236(2023) TaxID=3038163 RepID=UPI0024157858|nr:MFS transporter [Mycobacterium sp. 236(2023)]MDG4663148.1 MFS transporter [Mycobacterium sp. 236(2023)]